VRLVAILVSVLLSFFAAAQDSKSWIRINQLGYIPGGVKVAVWCSNDQGILTGWQLVDVQSGKVVGKGPAGKPFGAYGPFSQTYRLDFSLCRSPGRYYLQAGNARSPEFSIGNDVFKGSADFCLRYMRQQRSGFNPYLKDSCHTHDGYTLYGPMRDSTHIEVSGGWHDASDYLQYVTTTANATYHLLMAYRDFYTVFGDEKSANGLDGNNQIADILDEAKWGLDWLIKMHPRGDWMFNQLADDRDHMGMRIPKQDSFYGKGFERPVYFLNGKPQQRGKFLNSTTGTASTAGKFASAFALGSTVFNNEFARRKGTGPFKKFADTLLAKAGSAFAFGYRYPGVSQTASVRSPYIYEEGNWTDDMELAAAAVYYAMDPHIRDIRNLIYADSLAELEPVTPWLGKDTARHYQWYPFINLGHYELARISSNKAAKMAGYYREGISRVWKKAKENAFYRGVPFIWCSNNLTTSFAIQCYWYRQLTGDKNFQEFEQANFDWLFGCNPWGTSMVYGLPSWGDTPQDPHSAFTHLKNYPVDGGLVDGPVYGSIYKNLLGIKLYDGDEYAQFQSDLAVYHDDYGDYSTNEPTMDGTASLIYLLAAKEKEATGFVYDCGAIIRGDSTAKKIALVFTGDEFAEGAATITKVLKDYSVPASFFFTGRFYRNNDFKKLIRQIKNEGHYLGAHSDRHLLYCDWKKRDSLLITREQFQKDLLRNYEELNKTGIPKSRAKYFLPPYEWHNDSIAVWTDQLGLRLINITPGTRTHADYTWPGLNNYISTDKIISSISDYAETHIAGLNGFILLMHVGTDPGRKDKLYDRLPQILDYLISNGYEFQRIDTLLEK
jgi:endoglucanase